MPGFNTHYFFGTQCIEESDPSEVLLCCKKHKNAFALGLQGPDIFFYFAAAGFSRGKNLGSLLHVEDTGLFFQNMWRYLRYHAPRGERSICTAYLAGFLADKYDVDAPSSIARANERIKRSTEEAFRSTVHGYTSVTTVDSAVNLQNGKARYALYPVWILNTDWNGQKFTFGINGQTGKVAGDLPMDKGKFWTWLVGVSGAVTAAAFAISYLMWL